MYLIDSLPEEHAVPIVFLALDDDDGIIGMATATTTAVSTTFASNSHNGKSELPVKQHQTQPSDPTKQSHKPRRRPRPADNDILENMKRSSTRNDLVYLTKASYFARK